MRQSIFRAKRVDNDEWVKGYFAPYDDGKTIKFEIVTFGGTGLIHYEVKPSTVGQYTGFKDYYGNEIFEGDIFPPNGNLGYKEVCIGKVDDDVCGVYLQAKIGNTDIERNMYWITQDSAVKVVGNIHDNPKLLYQEMGADCKPIDIKDNEEVSNLYGKKVKITFPNGKVEKGELRKIEHAPIYYVYRPAKAEYTSNEFKANDIDKITEIEIDEN